MYGWLSYFSLSSDVPASLRNLPLRVPMHCYHSLPPYSCSLSMRSISTRASQSMRCASARVNIRSSSYMWRLALAVVRRTMANTPLRLYWQCKRAWPITSWQRREALSGDRRSLRLPPFQATVKRTPAQPWRYSQLKTRKPRTANKQQAQRKTTMSDKADFRQFYRDAHAVTNLSEREKIFIGLAVAMVRNCQP